MNLVSYDSDSDTAEAAPEREIKQAHSLPRPETGVSKPPLSRLVDPQNTHKIQVRLQDRPIGNASSPATSSDILPPAPKRIKLGGGGGSFNAMLPAPTRKDPVVNKPQSSFAARGSGRVNFKTAAEPAFIREPASTSEPVGTDGTQSGLEDVSPRIGEQQITASLPAPPAVHEPVVLKGDAKVFRPLSVGRKPQKKKTAVSKTSSSLSGAASTATISVTRSLIETSTVAPRPQVSLFGDQTVTEAPEISDGGSHGYQPLLYDTTKDHETDMGDAQETVQADEGLQQRTSTAVPSAAQSLQSIAQDLDLPASARRQLFGRAGRHGMPPNAAIKVVNFDTDSEYAANEAARAAGETPEQQHNPVRTINAAGRTSLKQLVGAVSNQTSALEEHFAKGRRNQREAGSKYGW